MAQSPDTKNTPPGQNTPTTSPAQNTQSDTQAAAHQSFAAENAAVSGMQTAVRRSSEAAQQAGGEFGEATRRSGAAAAEATRLTGQISGETTRRGAETLAEGQQSLIDDLAQHFERLGRHMAGAVQESASDLRSFVVVRQGTSESLRDLQEGFSGLVSGIIQSNVRMTQELLRIVNPDAVFNLQQRFVRDYMNALLQGSSAFIRLARRSADQTLEPIQERIEQRQQVQQRGNGRQPVVSDVMSSNVRLITPEDSVQQATRLMRDEDTGVLPVGEGDRLVGIVTDRDVALRVIAEGKDPQHTKVRDVMSQEPKYVFEDENLAHVADNMARQQLRRLPVVNRDKRLVGVVSIGDLARGDRAGRFAGKAKRGGGRPGGAQEGRTVAAE